MNESNRWDEYFDRALSDLTKTMPGAPAAVIAKQARDIADAAMLARRARDREGSEPLSYLARIFGHLVAAHEGPDTVEKLRLAAQDWTRTSFDDALAAALDTYEIERRGDKLFTPIPF